MFGVSRRDSRLRNKAEVLSFVVRGDAGVRVPVAIAADLLRKKPIYELQVGGRRFVVLTTAGGANRLYEAAGHTFTSGPAGVLTDATGAAWQVTEEGLMANGRRLPRVPARRTFWFAWYAQFPDTMLIQEGSDLARKQAQVRAAPAPLALGRLEGSFRQLSTAEATLAYAQSAAAAVALIDHAGAPAVVNLLTDVGNGVPFPTAFERHVLMSYAEFQNRFRVEIP